VRRGAHEEARFTEERRLESEIQDRAASHLQEEESRNDPPGASFDVHLVLQPWRNGVPDVQTSIRSDRCCGSRRA
jgi:hypothetical protein